MRIIWKPQILGMVREPIKVSAAKTDSCDVRGSGLVAMSSVDDLGLPEGVRRQRRTYYG